MTIWNRFGMPQAVNLGDAMFYFAVLLCQKVRAPSAQREALSRRLLTSTLWVIDGQEREFALKKQREVSLQDYFRMVEGKTSGLFALPMAAAAELCGADATLVDGLEEAARHMGVLFQIQDELLDLYGDKGREQRGNDLREGKRSLMAIVALRAASGEEADWLRAVLDRRREATTAADVQEAIRRFERAGAVDFAVQEIERRRSRVRGELSEHPRFAALFDGLCDLFLRPIPSRLGV